MAAGFRRSHTLAEPYAAAMGIDKNMVYCRIIQVTKQRICGSFFKLSAYPLLYPKKERRWFRLEGGKHEHNIFALVLL